MEINLSNAGEVLSHVVQQNAHFYTIDNGRLLVYDNEDQSLIKLYSTGQTLLENIDQYVTEFAKNDKSETQTTP